MSYAEASNSVNSIKSNKTLDALRLWVTHNPFKRASPELIKALLEGQKKHEDKQEALL